MGTCACAWVCEAVPVMKSCIAAIKGSPFLGVTKLDFTCNKDQSCDQLQIVTWPTNYMDSCPSPPSMSVLQPWPPRSVADGGSSRPHQSQHYKAYTRTRWNGMFGWASLEPGAGQGKMNCYTNGRAQNKKEFCYYKVSHDAELVKRRLAVKEHDITVN